jgi:hypothetical protein
MYVLLALSNCFFGSQVAVVAGLVLQELFVLLVVCVGGKLLVPFEEDGLLGGGEEFRVDGEDCGFVVGELFEFFVDVGLLLVFGASAPVVVPMRDDGPFEHVLLLPVVLLDVGVQG